MDHAWEPDALGGRGRFRNFMRHDRRWLPDGADEGADGGAEDGPARGGEDEEAQARALVALAAVARAPMPGLAAWAAERLTEALRAPALPLAHRSPRAWAQSLIACAVLVEPGKGPAGTREAARAATAVARELAARLRERLEAAARPGWPWFEDALAYDNARLCEGALLGAAHLPGLLAPALASLGWLCELQTGPGGVHRPFGTCGMGRAGVREAAFDQQPLEAWATADACARAHALTGAPRWRAEAARAHAWFLGANELGVVLADPGDGGCRDGLHPDRANANRGAESTLAWLHAELAMTRLDGRRERRAP